MTLNTGLQLAVPNTVTTGTTNITFRPIGTNLSCRADLTGDGRFSLDMTFDNSSVLTDRTVSPVSGIPAFQGFTMHNRLILTDGQTVQYASVTDPVTGQVTKVDVTLSVIK
jgi:type II secretory pathway component GspD/PulD (secretin)